MPDLTKKLVLTFSLSLATIFSVAQEIKDFSYRLIADKIEITYSLTGQSSDRYDVKLYSSLDDFAKPLSLVTGEVGKDVMPGDNKKVIWDARTELGEFEGDLSIKIRANFIPFLTFDIENGARFKRAKEQLISWELTEGESIKLELYQAGDKISDLGTVAAGTEYNWAIPKDLKTGGNYRIKASGSERFAMSDAFSIKRKIPLILWAVPAVVIGGVVAIIAGGSSGGSGDTGIPDPVGPN